MGIKSSKEDEEFGLKSLATGKWDSGSKPFQEMCATLCWEITQFESCTFVKYIRKIASKFTISSNKDTNRAVIRNIVRTLSHFTKKEEHEEYLRMILPVSVFNEQVTIMFYVCPSITLCFGFTSKINNYMSLIKSGFNIIVPFPAWSRIDVSKNSYFGEIPREFKNFESISMGMDETICNYFNVQLIELWVKEEAQNKGQARCGICPSFFHIHTLLFKHNLIPQINARYFNV